MLYWRRPKCWPNTKCTVLVYFMFHICRAINFIICRLSLLIDSGKHFKYVESSFEESLTQVIIVYGYYCMYPCVKVNLFAVFQKNSISSIWTTSYQYKNITISNYGRNSLNNSNYSSMCVYSTSKLWNQTLLGHLCCLKSAVSNQYGSGQSWVSL